MDSICDNIKSIKDSIESINKNCKLMAVSKTFPFDAVKKAYDCSHRLFGENRVQEAIEKIELSRKYGLDISWHLIGHLQKNKAKKAVYYFDCIESVDSVEIAERIDGYAEMFQKTIDIMLEVNIAQEPQKYGFLKEELSKAINKIITLKNINVIGLMCVAPVSENPEDVRWVFRKLRTLRDELNSSFNLQMNELSMGMSGDYLIAVEEGSTVVRIGRAIFGQRDYDKKEIPK